MTAMNSASSGHRVDRDYLPHVDGLRAVSVISVLLFHLNIPAFKGGYVGVDVFLVISGFLITRLMIQELEVTGRLSLKNFYYRRVRRILPALLATLAVSTILMCLILSPSHLEQYGGSLLAASFGVSNFFFWLEADYFATASQFKPLLHTWSLGVEEQFYFFWPLFLIAVYKIGLRKALPILFVAVILLSWWTNVPFSDGLVWRLSQVAPETAKLFEDGKSSLFFLLPFRVYEFALGGLMVHTLPFLLRNRSFNDILFLSGLFLIGWSVVTFDATMLFPMHAAWIPCGGAAMVIVSGQHSRFSRVLTHCSMVGVGLISYSLYLVHWPIMVAWFYLFGAPSLLSMCFLMGLSVILAWLSWRFVEVPCRNPILWSSGRIIHMVLAGVFILLIGAGWSMHRHGGWGFRVGHTIANIDLNQASAAFHRTEYGGAGYPYFGWADLGDVGPLDVILIGDSHARHYAEGLQKEWAKPRELRLFVASGTSCLYLPGFTRTTPGINWDVYAPLVLSRCLEQIRLAERPPVVILSHSWLYQMKEGALLDQGIPSRPLTLEDILQGILAFKQEIGPAPLVVIGQNPTTDGVDLYDIFTRPSWIQRWVTDPMRYLTTQPITETQAFNAALSDLAYASDAFTYLDPFDALCGNDGCQNLDDQKRLLYSDHSHFSKSGSRFVVRTFVPVLDEVLNQRP